jgi:hypothetical protein
MAVRANGEKVGTILRARREENIYMGNEHAFAAIC